MTGSTTIEAGADKLVYQPEDEEPPARASEAGSEPSKFLGVVLIVVNIAPVLTSSSDTVM